MCVFKTFKTLALVATSVVALSTSAMANEMISNNTSGVVQGSIYQSVGEDSKAVIEVGSISAEAAMNNRAFGHVGGNIEQYTGHFEENNKFTAQVGSIRARFADNNHAEGWVDGNIRQMAYGSDVTMDARVGSIDAGSGDFAVAFDNEAFGVVEGEIYQEAGARSKVSARIGAMGPAK